MSYRRVRPWVSHLLGVGIQESDRGVLCEFVAEHPAMHSCPDVQAGSNDDLNAACRLKCKQALMPDHTSLLLSTA